MNFLAHAYLSFNHPDILVGNMISDFVRGSARFSYPEGVQKGIRIHRDIDRFTDFHPAVKEAKKHFAPAYRLYAGAFVDIVLDHFLANDEKEFLNEQHLMDFSKNTYRLLSSYSQKLPESFSHILPYMISQNWLFHYRFPEGIEKSFNGLVRRAAFISDAQPAVHIFREQLIALQSVYEDFFPELKNHCRQIMEGTITL
jgi:acyl carrier protein phosphodiesterase